MKPDVTATAGKPAASTEENVYADVYRMLIGGMVISNVLFAIGVALAMLHPRYVPLTAAWVRSHYHVSTVVHGLATLDPTAYMLVATAILILTPVARVFVSIVAFFVDHDRKFVVVTSTVLLIMVVTVILGELGLT